MVPLLTCFLCTPAKSIFPKIYEFATGHWLFKPEATNDLSRDVVHLAQMTQCTGQDHDDVGLKQYESKGKQCDLKGTEIHHWIPRSIHLLHLQAF